MRIALPVALLAGVFVFGCTSSPGDGPTEVTGAALSVDYFGDTDVVGFHFNIERVECYAGESTTSARRSRSA